MAQDPKSRKVPEISVPEHEGEDDVSPVVSRPAKRATGRAQRSASSSQKQKPDKPEKKQVNRVREARIERMMSKAELARRAGLSVLTIDRVEKGLGCRMDTKRKILESLGLSLVDRKRVFGEEE
jgi:DNA-binding XRE family transcriptional regulator